MRKFYVGVLLALLGHLALPAQQVTSVDDLPQSGTLPVFYLTTENKQDITTKDTYVKAELGVDLSGGKDPGRLAALAPATLQVKGHGNYTFRGFDKKPYRLKFDEKVDYFQMPKNKHYLLMAGADDDLGFLRNLVGYELSRRIGLPYTTQAQPVELFLNDDYRGLYFYTEKLRVDKKRVNIVEQADNETNPENITGGWLVEIDNYDTDPHINVKIGDKDMIVTYHTPEILSDVQRNYLQTQWDAIAKALCSDDENDTEWEKYIDIESLAKVYIVRELMQDEEGFHGSCYVYKERGADTKWTFGPVWDFGNAYHNSLERYIFSKPEFECYVIDRAWKFKNFRDKVEELWNQFYASDEYLTLDSYITTMASKIAKAASADYQRWKGTNVCVTNDEMGKAEEFKNLLHNKANWLQKQWGKTPVQDQVYVYVCTEDDEAPYVYAWNGTDFGGWPGMQLSDSKLIGGKCFYYTTVKSGSNIIFSTVAEGTAADKVAGAAQVTQTEDIKGVNRNTYYRFYQAPEGERKDQKNGRFEDITSQVTTGIHAPSTVDAYQRCKSTAIYNLNGQRVNADYRGVVIQNGHKYLQK